MTKVKFTKEEAADFAVVEQIYRSLDATMVMKSYELGRAVVDTIEHATEHRDKYNRKVIDKFATALDCHAAILYAAGRVCRAWPDQAKFEELCSLVHEDGWRLRWTHFVHLTNNGVAHVREALAREAFKKRWTTAELLIAVNKTKKETNDAETRGRPASNKPRTVPECLKHIESQIDLFIDTADANWFGTGFDLIRALDEVPLDVLDDSLVAAVQTAADNMRNIAQNCHGYADMLRRKAAELVQKIEANTNEAAANTYEADEEEEQVPVVRRRGRPRKAAAVVG